MVGVAVCGRRRRSCIHLLRWRRRFGLPNPQQRERHGYRQPCPIILYLWSFERRSYCDDLKPTGSEPGRSRGHPGSGSCFPWWKPLFPRWNYLDDRAYGYLQDTRYLERTRASSQRYIQEVLFSASYIY
jgi:hypothetical protein